MFMKIEIVHDKLGHRKFSARWIPKMLSDEHKRQRVEISEILLHRCQQGDETVDVGPGGDHRARNKLLERLNTGDETWLHPSTPETKHDSMTWMVGSTRPLLSQKSSKSSNRQQK
ncbi:histone-lysine N-methyltransferase SETMAR [Plakobranchus ocellatus]|uniref:Histone-lysine N-methyltransferase SETMAR n=1 Tax=Plakobranchus ocellatus TaxID=259542 RepID=A0AAV4CQ56_9GAST|nr:histone-lysine N-methyltransferase SETMAR [Plakobranchus ocellatus]